ncbi:MAG: N-acetyltransferase [Paludibacteraceae bacterium]|nr:N-acetyltransferase [Paludibacteraceae bacterium]
MSVEIKKITNRIDLLRFVKFGNEFYSNCENFCPSLILDEMATFNTKKNPAFDVCEHVLYMAYKDGKAVGRIAGIINHEANRKWGVKHVRFGWMDFIDDLAVSKALLDAVVEWGKSKGMDGLNGPVGFTDFDHQGLIVEGFDYLVPMASLYNYPYYVQHMEAYGLLKENDWIEMQIYPPQELPERFGRMAKIVQERSHVRVDKVKNCKELVQKYGTSYMDVIDQAYQKLYNFQPLTDRQKRHYCDMYFPLLNFDFVTVVVNEKDEVVGVGVGMPDISKALRKCKGKLFPFGWYHMLKALHSDHYDTFDFLIIAVRPDYQDRGLNAVIIADQHPYFVKYNIHCIETTAIMETNFKNLNHWEVFPHKYHKRRRAYIKAI